MAEQIPLDKENQAHSDAYDEARDDGTHEVRPDVAYQRHALVNVIYISTHGDSPRDWVLVDTGIPGSAGAIKKAAVQRFGIGARPRAILMTHGHFDHVGALESLAEEWEVPIYAHPLELPYLDGSASYPPPDPMVGGGIMSLLSPLYPRGPVNVSRWLYALPPDGTVPPLLGWRWMHVPGHTPGQVAFWREEDHILIAADAFITTRQESAYAVAKQEPEMHGPPMYFTQDWEASHRSVERLAALEPEVVVTGHGRAMQGAAMRAALHTLARTFDQVAVPKHGKYAKHPATPDDGSAYKGND